MKETRFYYHTFLFFYVRWLASINTAQKTLKPSEKCFNSQDGWEKTSYLRISAEGYRRKHEMQVGSKKVCWRNNRVFQTLVAYRHWIRYFFRTWQVHFSIISKVSQVSYSRNTLYTGIMQFQFLRDPSNDMIPHQNKNFGPFSAKTSLTFLTQSWRGRVGGGG